VAGLARQADRQKACNKRQGGADHTEIQPHHGSLYVSIAQMHGAAIEALEKPGSEKAPKYEGGQQGRPTQICMPPDSPEAQTAYRTVGVQLPDLVQSGVRWPFGVEDVAIVELQHRYRYRVDCNRKAG
jgi:hypothetical protein